MNLQQRATELLNNPNFIKAARDADSELDNGGLPLDLPAVIDLAQGKTNVASDGDETLLLDIEKRLDRFVAQTHLESAGLFYADTIPSWHQARRIVRAVAGVSPKSRLEIPMGDPMEIALAHGVIDTDDEDGEMLAFIENAMGQIREE